MPNQLFLEYLGPIVGGELSVDEGLTALITAIKRYLEDVPDGRIIILMAGGTASGKSSLGAARIHESFPGQSVVFMIDMFYRGKRALAMLREQHGRKISWDEPLAVDLEDAAHQLQRLRAGQEANIPIYDFKESERIGMETVEAKQIIIAEGLFALHDSLRQEGDLYIYMSVDVHGQIMRRTVRDIVRKGREGNDILLDMAQTALPMQFKHVTTTKKHAHLVIINDYRPETETLRHQGIGLPQVKIGRWPPVGRMTQLGAEYLGTFEGNDRYFTAKDRDLAATGEEFRIRDESGRLSLTYKGPHLGSVGERFVFTCSIEEATVEALMQFYREALVFVRKSRRVFLLPGVLVSLDVVTLTNPSGTVIEGMEVTEVRLTGRHDNGLDVVNDMIKQLGLNPDASTPASYFSIALNPALLLTA